MSHTPPARFSIRPLLLKGPLGTYTTPLPAQTTVPALVSAQAMSFSLLPVKFNTALLATVKAPTITPPLQFSTASLATLIVPTIAPPVKSMTAKAPSAGTMMVPELIITWSLAAGTCCGDQLDGLFQSVETEPVQVRFVVTTRIALELRAEPKALLTITA